MIRSTQVVAVCVCVCVCVFGSRLKLIGPLFLRDDSLVRSL